jgi:hypothetical protein
VPVARDVRMPVSAARPPEMPGLQRACRGGRPRGRPWIGYFAVLKYRGSGGGWSLRVGIR